MAGKTELRLDQSRIAYSNKKKLANIYLAVLNEFSARERQELTEVLHTLNSNDLIEDFLTKVNVKKLIN